MPPLPARCNLCGRRIFWDTDVLAWRNRVGWDHGEILWGRRHFPCGRA